MINRWFYRCGTCLTIIAVEAERQLSQLTCACDGTMACMGRVKRDRLVHDTQRCACDARCTSARGPSCNCLCGGVNHGTDAVVAVVVDAGAVPRISPTDPAVLLARAAEYREARDAVDGALAADKDYAAWREGRWLPASAWTRCNRLQRARSSAAALKVHGTRLKRMRELFDLVTRG